MSTEINFLRTRKKELEKIINFLESKTNELEKNLNLLKTF